MYIPDHKTVFIQRVKITAAVLIFCLLCGCIAALNFVLGALLFTCASAFWIITVIFYIPLYYSRYSIRVSNEYVIINKGLFINREITLYLREIQYCETTSLLPKTIFGAALIKIYTCGSKIVTCPFDIKISSKIIQQLESRNE